ncbi:MAG: hypothetical protein FWC11_01960 [Firmicutes bacterium]|nr:hypothetical protein [Bacillota bacterium]MCL2255606.1 hypothetical protein [Bacillota bacterium]
MSIDVFIYSEKKMPKNYSLLTACGYFEDGDEYMLDNDDGLVFVSCSEIKEELENENMSLEMVEKIREFVPNVKYSINFNFSGNCYDKTIEEADLCIQSLAKELKGAIHDTIGDSVLMPCGSVVYYDFDVDENGENNHESPLVFSDKPFEEYVKGDETALKKANKFRAATIATGVMSLMCFVSMFTFFIVGQAVLGFVFGGLAVPFFVFMIAFNTKDSKYRKLSVAIKVKKRERV